MSISVKYPNLRIELSSETLPDIKVTGKSNFVIETYSDNINSSVTCGNVADVCGGIESGEKRIKEISG